MYTVYGNRRSGSAIVELALCEADLDYRVLPVDLSANAQREVDYARVNPQRKLPALICPGGERLTESVAIVLTLDERHPGARLLPVPASAERARALRWMLFVATEMYPLIEINDYPDRFAPGPDDASALRERVRDIWRQRWLLVEAQIGDGPFLHGQTFSMADAYIAVTSRWAQQDDWRPENLPRIERLARAVSERPACAAAWARHFG